jgi:tRNA U34 5-carboxymethylaminomethyl modifying GTPase MnmE/TrmE
MSRRLGLFVDDINGARAKYIHELSYTVVKFAETIGATIAFPEDFHIEDVAKAVSALTLLKESKLQQALKGVLKEIAILIALPTFDVGQDVVSGAFFFSKRCFGLL